MKLFLAILSLAFHAALASAADRSLSSLTTDWAMTVPAFVYDDPTNIFTVTWSHGLGGTGIWDVFSTCPDGPDSITAETTVTQVIIDTGAGLGLTTTSPGDIMESLKFKIDPAITTVGSVWTDNGATAEAKFCLRVGVQNADFDIVNLEQIAMVMTFNLQGEMKLDQFTAEARDPVDEKQEDVLTLTTALCGGQTPPFEPGDEICMQVCPKDNSYELTAMSNLKATGKAGAGLSVDLVESLVIPATYTQGDQVSTLRLYTSTVDPFYKCGEVTFVLDGGFFPRSLTKINVKITGTATFAPARRRLTLRGGHEVEVRGLAEEATGDIEMDVTLASSPESGATSVTLTAAGMAGALLLL